MFRHKRGYDVMCGERKEIFAAAELLTAPPRCSSCMSDCLRRKLSSVLKHHMDNIPTLKIVPPPKNPPLKKREQFQDISLNMKPYICLTEKSLHIEREDGIKSLAVKSDLQ